jgi:hypothetical protein
MPEGARKRGRQKRWLDDVKGWTALNIQQAVHMAQDRNGLWAGSIVSNVGLDRPQD